MCILVSSSRKRSMRSWTCQSSSDADEVLSVDSSRLSSSSFSSSEESAPREINRSFFSAIASSNSLRNEDSYGTQQRPDDIYLEWKYITSITIVSDVLSPILARIYQLSHRTLSLRQCAAIVNERDLQSVAMWRNCRHAVITAIVFSLFEPLHDNFWRLSIHFTDMQTVQIQLCRTQVVRHVSHRSVSV